MVRTLVTRATGTLGGELLSRLLESGHDVRAASRSPPRDRGGEAVEWVLRGSHRWNRTVGTLTWQEWLRSAGT